MEPLYPEPEPCPIFNAYDGDATMAPAHQVKPAVLHCPASQTRTLI